MSLKVLGELKAKSEKDVAVDIEVGGQKIRAWKTMKRGQDTVPNPAIAELEGCRVGQFVEAVYDTRESNGRTYSNLRSIAIQTGEPQTSAPPVSNQSDGQTASAPRRGERQNYGKSAVDRIAILVTASNHDATEIVKPWIEANSKKNPDWLVDNWEVVTKAHANLSAGIANYSLGTMEEIAKLGGDNA